MITTGNPIEAIGHSDHVLMPPRYWWLKRLSIAGGYAKETDAPALARTFTDLIDRYGRSFELGLASRYYLFNKPLSMLKMGPLGISMFTRGRLSLLPTKIRQIDQLQAIIEKAKELGGAS